MPSLIDFGLIAEFICSLVTNTFLLMLSRRGKSFRGYLAEFHRQYGQTVDRLTGLLLYCVVVGTPLLDCTLVCLVVDGFLRTEAQDMHKLSQNCSFIQID